MNAEVNLPWNRLRLGKRLWLEGSGKLTPSTHITAGWGWQNTFRTLPQCSVVLSCLPGFCCFLSKTYFTSSLSHGFVGHLLCTSTVPVLQHLLEALSPLSWCSHAGRGLGRSALCALGYFTVVESPEDHPEVHSP